MCLCCTTLRGVTYFMVNVHMLGTIVLFSLSAHTYLFQPLTKPPPGLEDVNPIFIQNFPLLLGGYALVAALFACFIYRAVDMESLFQLTWSVVSFGGFQFLVIFLHLVFTVMFRDLVSTRWQVIMISVLIANSLATVVYLTVLFLYGKKIHFFKYEQNLRRNSLSPSNFSSSTKKRAYSCPNGIAIEVPDRRSRANSVCKSTSTEEEVDLEPPPSLDQSEENQSNSPPPSYQSTPDV